MKALIFAAALLCCTPAFAHSHSSGYHASRSSRAGAVHVHGYTTRSGRYVQPHMRTAPDHTRRNNWSSRGNVNPYTGKVGTKDPDRTGH